MTNFDCCKTKPFPASYYICVNCFRVFHRSCVLKEKSKYAFLEGYKLKCCEKLNNEDIFSEEKSILEETISELTDNSNLREQYINRMREDHKQFIEEVTLRENELNNFIKKQEETLEKANREIDKLKREISLFSNLSTSSQSTQTEVPTYAEKKSQTEMKNQQRHSRHKELSNVNDINSGQRKKICLVATHDGKDLVHFLANYLNDYSIQSIIKSNATNYELTQTAISLSKTLNKNDYLVIWPVGNNTFPVQGVCYNLCHTNLLILSTPERLDNTHENEKIYQSNLSLCRTIHSTMGNLDCF